MRLIFAIGHFCFINVSTLKHRRNVSHQQAISLVERGLFHPIHENPIDANFRQGGNYQGAHDVDA